MKKTKFTVLLVLLVLPFYIFAAGQTESSDNILRVASKTEGTELIKIYDQIIEDFTSENSGVSVQWDRVGGDYEFEGLISSLQSLTPPDIYYEWGGNRIRNHVADGELEDLSSVKTKLSNSIGESAWSGTEVKGKTYMIPTTQDVSVLIWYNVDIFNKLGLSVPKTWSEFLSVCDTISSSNITPILIGNADAWPAGNFISLFLSRVAGDEYFDSVLSMKEGTSFNNPGFVKALQYAYDLGKSGFINSDLNTLSGDESYSRLFDNSSAMYPIGTWFKSRIIPDYAPDPSKANFDFFNLPAFEDGKGLQSSYIGVNTGFVLNSASKKKELAKEFLMYMEQQSYGKQFAKTGVFPAVQDTLDLSDLYLNKVNSMMQSTKVVVSPPDDGYNLEMANALYQAIAKVLVNELTPEEALSEVDNKVAHLR